MSFSNPSENTDSGERHEPNKLHFHSRGQREVRRGVPSAHGIAKGSHGRSNRDEELRYLVGTTPEYLMRFYLHRHNPRDRIDYLIIARQKKRTTLRLLSSLGYTSVLTGCPDGPSLRTE